jgi:hypothetical protein
MVAPASRQARIPAYAPARAPRAAEANLIVMNAADYALGTCGPQCGQSTTPVGWPVRLINRPDGKRLSHLLGNGW